MPRFSSVSISFWITFASGALLIILFISYILISERNEIAKQKLLEQQEQSFLEKLKNSPYDDQCDGNDICRRCKLKLACVQCIGDCYNRFGDYRNEGGEFEELAIACYQKCWKGGYQAPPPKSDFDINAVKRKP